MLYIDIYSNLRHKCKDNVRIIEHLSVVFIPNSIDASLARPLGHQMTC